MIITWGGICYIYIMVRRAHPTTTQAPVYEEVASKPQDMFSMTHNTACGQVGQTDIHMTHNTEYEVVGRQ